MVQFLGQTWSDGQNYMDETTIPIWYDCGKGWVQVPLSTKQQVLLQQEQRASLSKRRTSMSLLCFLSSDPTIQRYCLQVMLANERTLSKTDWQKMELELAHRSDYFILRRKSAWANVGTLQELFRLLGACLEPFRNTHQITLLLDVCPVHVSTRVIKAAADHGFRLVFVPVGLTGVLQPLDAYFFDSLKQNLRLVFSEIFVHQEQRTDVSTLDVAFAVENL